MRTLHDYEAWGVIDSQDVAPELLEAYSGTAIVSWFGNIERQLQGMIEKYEAGRNFPYADKVRQFLQTWRENEITGSINREQLEPLKAATAGLAVDGWKLNNYFSNLRDQIRKLIASEEELPPLGEVPERGGGPPPADFGPSPTAPPNPGAPPVPPGEEGATPPPGGPPPPPGESVPPPPAR